MLKESNIYAPEFKFVQELLRVHLILENVKKIFLKIQWLGKLVVGHSKLSRL